MPARPPSRRRTVADAVFLSGAALLGLGLIFGLLEIARVGTASATESPVAAAGMGVALAGLVAVVVGFALEVRR